MRLKFTKMQGVGNDFVMIDGVSRDIKITPQLAKRLADRHFGVGCDQVLLVEKPQLNDADFRYRIWNADGEEVEQCGNGARCFVRFVHDKGLTKKNEIRVETLSGVIVPRLEADGQVSVDMGAPIFEPERVPFDTRGLQPMLGGKRWPLDRAGREAVVAGIREGLLDGTVHVTMRGGELTIRWRGGDNPVWMTGPAVVVFEGEIEIES